MTTTIEEGLVAFLTAQAAIAAIIGGGADARLYPAGGVPDDVDTPYMTYRKVSGPRDVHHGNRSNLATPRFQLSHWSESYLAAKQLARASIDALSGYRGAMGGVTRVAAAIDNEIDLFVPEEKFHQVAVDVLLWHSED